MAKFKYRMQGYLNLKQKLEDQKKQEYGLAIAEVEHEKQVKVELLNNIENQIVQFKTSIYDAISPQNFNNYNNYIELLKKKVINQDKVITFAERKAEKKREELVEAMKQRKMLETLKEHSYESYIKEEQLSEQKIVDEIVSYQYNNREN